MRFSCRVFLIVNKSTEKSFDVRKALDFEQIRTPVRLLLNDEIKMMLLLQFYGDISVCVRCLTHQMPNMGNT